MRMLIRFGKAARLRFISHLDLQRFFQRALSRSGLPIAYSQGFNPHAVMSFASALALGWTSEYEVLDVRLASLVDREFAETAMRNALPADLPVIEVKMCEDGLPAPMARVKMSEYRIENSGVTADILAKFLDSEIVTAVRKTKSGEREINIRPLASETRLENGTLFARLMLTEKDTLKPDLLVTALVGECAGDMRIHRLSLLGEANNGELSPIMKLY